MKNYDRRTFVQRAGLLSVLACLPASALAQIISKTPPISPFGADSTAEQVTEGLNLAGKTYAGVAQRNGRALVVVLMKGSGDLYGQAIGLLDWGFAQASGTLGERYRPSSSPRSPRPSTTQSSASLIRCPPLSSGVFRSTSTMASSDIPP